MMVVDCSVTMPWLLKNDASGYSEKTLDALLTGSAIVPALWHIEVQNMLLMSSDEKGSYDRNPSSYADSWLIFQLPRTIRRSG